MSDHRQREIPWWDDGGGFFGDLYLEADDSMRTFFEGDQDLDARTNLEVSGVVSLCRLTKGARVLDCPCGYGRHSVGLARRSFDVVGIDISSRFLDLASEASARAGVKVDLVRADMRELPAIEPVDAVINTFYSFGFFATEADDSRVLREFYQVLKPGGRLLMHTMITLPAYSARRIPEEERRRLRSGSTLVSRRRLDPQTRREEGEWVVVASDGRQQRLTPYSMRVYSAVEFARMCREVGFSAVDLYGDWDGRPYKEQSRYLIAVARK